MRYQCNGKGKAEPGDEEGQQRCDNDATSTCSVHRPTEGYSAATVEPRCDDDVDSCAAHCGPPNGHHGERRIDLPGPSDKGEQHHSARHRDGSYNDNFPWTVMLEKRTDPEDQQGGSENVVRGYRRGQFAGGPAVKRIERHEVDARTIEM